VTASPADIDRWVDVDGNSLRLRAVVPQDAAALMRFHEGLSSETIYRRFLGPHPRLSTEEARRFVTVDYVDRLALVVEDGDRLVAVGRYDRLPGTGEAEVAFVVADAYQHHGIGKLLLDELAVAARTQGVVTFVASTLSDNRDMLRVFFDSGYDVATSHSTGVVDVRFDITGGGSGR
jgi:GNAT superfamily N-acetyltransferase